MKTYEEMARDVLKRRDEELLKTKKTQNYEMTDTPPEVVYPASSKKRGLLPKIAVPCAAAVLVGTVGVTVWNDNRRGGGYSRNVAAQLERAPESGVPEIGKPDIALENSVGNSSAPSTAARETNINILNYERFLEKLPDHTDHTVEVSVNCKFEEMTIAELNDMYGIQFDKLSGLHADWSMSADRLGITYKERPAVVTESYAASGSRETVSTLNRLVYTTPDGAKLEVSAELATIPEMPEPELSEDDYSVLNGYRALVMGADHEGKTLYGAIIQMDRACVQISVEGFSEEEFIKVLREYTGADDKGEDNIVIHDTMPDLFRNLNPFSPVCGNLFDDLTFEPYKDINGYYGIEFDRLTRLHSDWNAQHNDFGIYARDTADEFSVSHEIVWTRNRINYTLPNTAEFYVEAQCGSLPKVITGTYPHDASEITYSVVNGFRAIIYRGGDAYDDREFPNGDTRFGAVVEIGGTVVHLSAAGLTEEEFLNVLREYTEEPLIDNKEPVAVEPVPEGTP